MENNELYHHGVKGMKWGVRRSRSSDDLDDKVKNMSDQELRNALNRAQMEKQYKKLNTKDVSKGRKAVTGILAGAAATVATHYIVKYAKEGVDGLIGAAGKKRRARGAYSRARAGFTEMMGGITKRR